MPSHKETAEPRKRNRLAKKPLLIKEEIERRIKVGTYSAQMPSLVKLAEDFAANQLTVLKALDSLEREGLIERRKRVGVFVKRKQRVALLYVADAGTASTPNILGGLAYLPLAEAVELELARSNYSLTRRACLTSDTEFATAIKNEVDGCVIVASNLGGGFLRHFKGIPCVRAMCLPGGEMRLVHISYDNGLIGPLAAEHLASRGCQTLVYFGHGKPTIFEERLASFKAKAEADHHEFAHVHADAQMDDGALFAAARDGLRQLLSRRPPAEIGLYISADLFAASAYQALYSLGLTPGVDLPVLSTDNNPSYLHGLHPRPPTIDIRMAEIGRTAAQSLMDIIAGRRAMDGSDETIIFPPAILGDDK